MQVLIETANRVQKALHEAKLKVPIDLPRIAVVGAQSSGKSSVLESIVGEDFLPKGTGIVTRCPLILQLLHSSGEEKTQASFDHLPNEEFKNFTDVSKEILKKTDELAGKEKGVVDKPIYLTIKSNHVPNLTLIDLPGVTRVVTDGQSENLCQEIEDLVMKYIKQENTIILAVCPANTDIANSEAIRLSKTVDPSRERTFGVITKVDIMDKGTDACEFLSGKKYKLKHGYILVKNRSQKDNNSSKTIKDSIKDEEKFFTNHPSYKEFAETQGTRMLATKLSKLLADHIVTHLPTIEKTIDKQYREHKANLEALGSKVECKTDVEAITHITKLIEEYTKAYEGLVKGSDYNSGDDVYSGGSFISKIFEYYANQKITQIDPFKNLTNKRILVEMKKSKGLNPELFIPEKACRNLITENLELFLDPAIKCASLVYRELVNAVTDAMPKRVTRMVLLKDLIQNVVETLLKKSLGQCQEFIGNLVKSEISFVNYEDEYFSLFKPSIRNEIDLKPLNKNEPEYRSILELCKHFNLETKYFCKSQLMSSINESIQDEHKKKTVKKVNTTVQDSNSNPDKWKVTQQIEFDKDLSKEDIENIISMRKVIYFYYSILKKSFKANIPKHIVHFLVDNTLKNLREVVHEALKKHDDLKSLLEEDPEAKKDRELLQKNVEQLKIAQKALKDAKYSSFK